MSIITSDLKEAAEKMQQQRLKTSKMIDSFYVEVEAMTGGASACSSSSDMWNYRDRVEEIKAAVYKLLKSSVRNMGGAKEAYDDSMREAMARVKNTGGLHFSEREAGYQIRNIDTYKVLVNLERSITDLTNFSRYLDGRLQWIKDRQRWLLEKEKGL